MSLVLTKSALKIIELVMKYYFKLVKLCYLKMFFFKLKKKSETNVFL